ncbi:MAG: tetratricopeptide repeat protein [Roseococcus sp.]|nr:tetratricopeptide repeat protein [Roseococcus sp.]
MRRMILAGLLLATPALADSSALLARGNAWRALDEFGAALRDYDQALREAPGRADLLAERALTLHRLGELEAARTTLAAAIAAAGPRDPVPFTARAGLALLARRDAAAEQDLAEALRRAPADGRALALQTLLAARRGLAPAPDPATMEQLRHAFGPWLDV